MPSQRRGCQQTAPVYTSKLRSAAKGCTPSSCSSRVKRRAALRPRLASQWGSGRRNRPPGWGSRPPLGANIRRSADESTNSRTRSSTGGLPPTDLGRLAAGDRGPARPPNLRGPQPRPWDLRRRVQSAAAPSMTDAGCTVLLPARIREPRAMGHVERIPYFEVQDVHAAAWSDSKRAHPGPNTIVPYGAAQGADRAGVLHHARSNVSMKTWRRGGLNRASSPLPALQGRNSPLGHRSAASPVPVVGSETVARLPRCCPAAVRVMVRRSRSGPRRRSSMAACRRW